MQLDLRIPMGLLFSLVGIILTLFGLATRGDAMYARSLGINANLDWGVVLVIFGVAMFVLGRRGQSRAKSRPPKLGTGDAGRRGH